MKSTLKQLKQVLRRLGRAPMFTAATLLTIAIGVGATTAVFSVVEGVLLKPLPYPHPEELVGVWHKAPGLNIPQLAASPSTYFIYREQNRSFEDIGLYMSDSVNLTGVAEPEQVRALRVTDGALSILGAAPMLGRGFTRQDGKPESSATVILGYGYWRHKFGGDPSIVGRTLNLDGEPHQVIGVMPQRFRFLDAGELPLFIVFRFDRGKTELGNFSYQALARLKHGVTVTQANADIDAMLPVVNRSFPAPEGFSVKLFEQAKIAANIHPLKQDVVGDIGKVLWILMGTIGMVLLIACANVANLLLVRTEGRQQELAIRAALGAGWKQIASELLFESLFLGLAGSALGLGIAYGALRLIVALAPAGLPRVGEIGIDGPVLLFSFAMAILSGLLFGSIPIFKYAGVHLGTGLREGGRTLSQTREQHRARSGLVLVQVALALVLLICSGLLIRTFQALTRVDPGFAGPAQIQTFSLSIPDVEVKEPERVARMQDQIRQKIEALPGVSSAAITNSLPMSNNGGFDPVIAEDRHYAEGEIPPLRRFKFVSPGFLATMGTPLVAGRDFTWTDIYNKNDVAMVSENLAREYWRTPSGALGKRIRVGTTDNWREIVGVTGDVYDDGVNQQPPTSAYWPMMARHFYGQETLVRRDVTYVVRSPRAGSESLMQEVRRAVWSVDPNIPVADVHTEDYFYRKSMARTSFTLVMLAVAASMALLLGIVGLYGVLAYSVLQRTREIGIRMALGAEQRELTGMFVRQGLWLAAGGIVCGLAAAVALMRVMSSMLFKVSPFDPVTYAIMSIAMVATAMLASYLPSRRAARVDPTTALRAE